MKVKDNTLAYGYIDSNAIREYNRKINTCFSPMEQAVLVYHSKRINVEQKIKIWKKLLETFTEEEFQQGKYMVHKPEVKNKVVVELTKQVFEQALQIIKIQIGMLGLLIYEARFWECDYPDEANVSKGYFRNYDDAYKFLQNEKRKYMEDDLYSTKVRAEIIGIKLDEQYSRDGCIYQYNNEMELIDIFPPSGEIERSGMSSVYLKIPIPFGKGDLVKTIGLDKVRYGVVNTEYKDIELKSSDVYKDSTDMHCCLDVCWNSDFDSKLLFGWGMYEYLDLEYCDPTELPANQKMLVSISEAYQGKMTLGMLCQGCILGRME